MPPGSPTRMSDGRTAISRSSIPDFTHSPELRSLIVKRPALTTVEVMAGPVRGRRRTHVVTGYVHKPYALIYTMLARCAGFDTALIVRGIEGGIIPSLRQGAKVWSYHDGGDVHDTDISPDAVDIEQAVRAVPLPEGIEGYRRKSDETGVPRSTASPSPRRRPGPDSAHWTGHPDRPVTAWSTGPPLSCDTSAGRSGSTKARPWCARRSMTAGPAHTSIAVSREGMRPRGEAPNRNGRFRGACFDVSGERNSCFPPRRRFG